MINNMAITLSSSSLTNDQEQIEDFRAKQIEECRSLLKRLRVGTYTIYWDGILPFHKSQARNEKEKNLEIIVENAIEYGKFIYLRKPYLTKQIKVGGKNMSCIRTWKPEQLATLITKLKQIIS